MKNSLLTYGLLAALLLCATISGAAQSSANFSGAWVLDKERSSGLPQGPQGFDNYSLIAVQQGNQLTVETKMSGENRAGANSGGSWGGRGGGFGRMGGRGGGFPGGGFPGGGGNTGNAGGYGGGRGGPRGGAMALPKVTYTLDGQETTMEAEQGRVLLRAAWFGETMLELQQVRQLNFQGNERTLTSREQWTLSEGGQVLQVQRTMDTPRGAMEMTLIFNKTN